jgi:hypothetical protein
MSTKSTANPKGNSIYHNCLQSLTNYRQVYVEFQSQAASTAFKHCIDNLDPKKSDAKNIAATYFIGLQNPYKTLPKDTTRREQQRPPVPTGTNYNNNSNQQSNYQAPAYRGGRGGYQSRGANMNNYGGGRGGFQNQPPMGPMNGGNMAMAGAYNNMNNGYNNFNRGGMMNGGMRGGMGGRGRGGMGHHNPPMMNPMGMGMNMGMGGPAPNPMGMMNMGGKLKFTLSNLICANHC